MFTVGKTHKTVYLLTILLAFFLVGFLSLAQTNVVMGSDAKDMSNCPFMPGMTSLCQMSPLEHLTAWQTAFTAIPNQADVLAILLLLLALALSTFKLYSNQSASPPRILVPDPSSTTYYKTHIPIVSPLQEAFSDGILHPKLYNAHLS